MEFDVIDGFPIYTCTKIKDLVSVDCYDFTLGLNESVNIVSAKKCNKYINSSQKRKKDYAKKLILQIKRSELKRFGLFKCSRALFLTGLKNYETKEHHGFKDLNKVKNRSCLIDEPSVHIVNNVRGTVETRKVLKTLKVNENLQDRIGRSVYRNNMNKINSFNGFTESSGMEKNKNNESLSPGPPVLTPEVDINLAQSADLRCSLCSAENLFTDIELYNHIKCVHGDVRNNEVQNESLCRVKRKGEMFNAISTTPEKVQKVRNNERLCHEDDPKENHLGILPHSEDISETQRIIPSMSVNVNRSDICPNDKSAIHFGTEFELCEKLSLESKGIQEKQLDIEQQSPFFNSTQSLSTREYTEHLKEVGDKCNSSFKIFRGNKYSCNVTSDTCAKRCLFMPETSSEESTDFFVGRMADSVFSPAKNGNSPAKLKAKFEESLAKPKQQPIKSCSFSSVLEIPGTQNITMYDVSQANRNVLPNEANKPIYQGCESTISRICMTVPSSSDILDISHKTCISNSYNLSNDKRPCTSLYQTQKHTENSVPSTVSPCVIQPATNVPSQNISVLSQQARFISRKVNCAVDNETINCGNTSTSTGRPVSTCIIQPAATTLTNCVVNTPAFTGSSFLSMKNNQRSGNFVLGQHAIPNRCHYTSNMQICNKDNILPTTRNLREVDEEENLENNKDNQTIGMQPFSGNNLPHTQNITSSVSTYSSQLQCCASLSLTKTNPSQFVTNTFQVLSSPSMMCHSSKSKSTSKAVSQPQALHISVPGSSTGILSTCTNPTENVSSNIFKENTLPSNDIYPNTLDKTVHHVLPTDTVTVSQKEHFTNTDSSGNGTNSQVASVKSVSISQNENDIQNINTLEKRASPDTINSQECHNFEMKISSAADKIHSSNDQRMASVSNGAIVLYCCGINTNDQTITSINQTKLEDSNNENLREGIFVVCTNCGTNSAKYDKCDSCHKPLPQCAKLYEPIIRQRSFSEGSSTTKVGLRQSRNLSDSALDTPNREHEITFYPVGRGKSPSEGSPIEEHKNVSLEMENNTNTGNSHVPSDSRIRTQIDSSNQTKGASEFLTAQSAYNQTIDPQAADITTKLDVNTIVVQFPISELWFGTFKAVPADLFKITTKGVQLTFEHNLQYLNKIGEGVGLRIHIGSHDIRNIKLNLNKQYPVMLLQTSCACEQKIQHVLEMTFGKEPFYSFSSKDPRHKRITIMFNNLGGFGIEKYLKLLCMSLIEDHPLKYEENVTFEEISFDVVRNLIQIPLQEYGKPSHREIEIQANTTIPISESSNVNATCSEQEENNQDTLENSESIASGEDQQQENTVCLDEEEEDVIIVDEVIKQNEFQKNLAFLKPTRRRVKPKLLEIQSNCDWSKIRGKLTSVMSKILGNRTRYPDQKTITLDNFNVSILPKPKQQTRVPKTLISKFESFYVYPICVKITPLPLMYEESTKTVIDLTKDSTCRHPNTSKSENDRMPSASTSAGNSGNQRKSGKKIVGDVIQID